MFLNDIKILFLKVKLFLWRGFFVGLYFGSLFYCVNKMFIFCCVRGLIFFMCFFLYLFYYVLEKYLNF